MPPAVAVAAVLLPLSSNCGMPLSHLGRAMNETGGRSHLLVSHLKSGRYKLWSSIKKLFHDISCGATSIRLLHLHFHLHMHNDKIIICRG